MRRDVGGFWQRSLTTLPPFLHKFRAQVYALVGVAAMLAGNCRVPLTSVLLLFELTRDYFIILVRLNCTTCNTAVGRALFDRSCVALSRVGL